MAETGLLYKPLKLAKTGFCNNLGKKNMKHLSHGKEVYQQSFDTKIFSKSAGSQAGEVGVVLLVKPACVYFSCAHFFHIITRNPKHREKAQTFLWWNVGI